MKPILLSEKAGLTDSEVARLIGVSRDLLSKYRRSDRSLPTPALVRLGQIERFVSLAPAAGLPVITAEARNKAQQQLHWQITNTTLQLQAAQQRVAAAAQVFRQQQVVQQLVAHLGSTSSPSPYLPVLHRKTSRAAARVAEKYMAASLRVQLLEARLQGLQQVLQNL
jgi:transcriptional regulator with XRE-family HTH domain